MPLSIGVVASHINEHLNPLPLYVSPPIASDIVLHVDPSRGSFYNNSGAEINSNGQQVYKWKDKSLFQVDFLQSTGSLQPTLNMLDGPLPYLKFNVSRLVHQGGTVFSNTMNRTTFVVSRRDNALNTRNGIWGNRGPSSCGQVCNYQGSTTFSMTYICRSGLTRVPSSPIQNFNIITTQVRSNSFSMKFNNDTWASNSATYSSGTVSLHMGSEAIGGFSDYYGDISIGEMLIYNRLLLESEVQIILSWLADKWAITL